MASSENSNLVTEFEQAFAEALATLCEEDTLCDRTTIEDQKISRFTDLARQLEMFFLQKRFLVHAHKPELILKEDSNELRTELQKKDELLRKHYEKLVQWQSLLQDMNSGAPATQPSANPGTSQGPSKLHPGGPMQQAGPGAAPGGFVPGNNYRMNPAQQSPLAYLEKTTTTIGR